MFGVFFDGVSRGAVELFRIVHVFERERGEEVVADEKEIMARLLGVDKRIAFRSAEMEEGEEACAEIGGVVAAVVGAVFGCQRLIPRQRCVIADHHNIGPVNRVDRLPDVERVILKADREQIDRVGDAVETEVGIDVFRCDEIAAFVQSVELEGLPTLFFEQIRCAAKEIISGADLYENLFLGTQETENLGQHAVLPVRAVERFFRKGKIDLSKEGKGNQEENSHGSLFRNRRQLPPSMARIRSHDSRRRSWAVCLVVQSASLSQI